MLGFRSEIRGIRCWLKRNLTQHLIPHSERLNPVTQNLKPDTRHLIPECGYTLIELMIVVSIAGILVTLAEPSFRATMLKAREAALKQDLFTLREVLDQYRADRGRYPSALGELQATGYIRYIPVDPFTKSDTTWQEILDQNQGGVFDVHSGSDLVALDGTPYNNW